MNLKKYRLMLNKTQTEVANDLNMPRTKYARYELKTAEPNIQTLKQLADYFHTTVDYLIGHEVPYLINKSEFSAEQLLVLDELKHLSKEQCGRLLSYIDGLKDRR